MRRTDIALLAGLLSLTAAYGEHPAATPAGFIRFCLDWPDQCHYASHSPVRIGLTPERLRLIERINRAVNDEIWPEDDLRHYGRAEMWAIPRDGYGDCEDYALAKRQRLMAAGLPLPALRVAIVDSPASGRHAVLTVVTDQGDLVLDNLDRRIRKPEETDYTWIARQDAGNPFGWVDLAAPTASAPVAAIHTYAESTPPIADGAFKRTLRPGKKRLREQQ